MGPSTRREHDSQVITGLLRRSFPRSGHAEFTIFEHAIPPFAPWAIACATVAPKAAGITPIACHQSYVQQRQSCLFSRRLTALLYQPCPCSRSSSLSPRCARTTCSQSSHGHAGLARHAWRIAPCSASSGFTCETAVSRYNVIFHLLYFYHPWFRVTV